MDSSLATTDPVALAKSLENALVVLRLAMAGFFGISFLLNGMALQGEDTSSPRSATLFKIGRVCFVIATSFIIAYFTLAFISPFTPVSEMVFAGIALVLASSTLVVDRWKNGVPALSFLSGAFIWLLVVIVPFLSPGDATEAKSLTWLSGFHITTAILGEGLFVAAFFASLLYLWDYRNLKKKVLGKSTTRPSLNTLDKIVERVSIVGLFVITVSLISGLALVTIGNASANVGYTKIIWAFSVWGWYVLCLFGRGLWGWRGRRGAQLSVWGAGILVLALFGTIWETLPFR